MRRNIINRQEEKHLILAILQNQTETTIHLIQQGEILDLHQLDAYYQALKKNANLVDIKVIVNSILQYDQRKFLENLLKFDSMILRNTFQTMQACIENIIFYDAANCFNYIISNDKDVHDLLKSNKRASLGFNLFPDLMTSNSFINLAIQQARTGKTRCLELLYGLKFINNAELLQWRHGKTQLMLSAEKGELDLVKFFVKIDPLLVHKATESNVYHPTPWDIGRTALYFACQNGHIEIVKHLILAGANINAKTAHLDSVFHAAVYSKRIDLLELLKSAGAGPLSVDADGDSAMEWAIELGGDLNLIIWFLAQGQKIEDTNYKGLNFFHIAAQQGNLNVLHFFKNYLGNRFTEVLKSKNKINGMNVLHYAASKGHDHVIQWLYNHHMSIDEKTNDGNTALLCAAKIGYLRCVKQLRNYGASFNVNSNNGDTVLISAVTSGNLELIKWLMDEEGLSFEGQRRLTGGCDHCTPFHAAAFKNHVHVLEWFVQHKFIDVNITDRAGCTALFYAAMGGAISAMEWLTAKGSQITKKAMRKYTDQFNGADSGTTPLHCAAKGGQLEASKWLLERGADIHAVTQNGHTVLHVAALCGNLELVKFLKDKGINIHAKANNSSTALAFAVIGGKLEILKFLIESGVEPYYRDKIKRIPYHTSLLHLAIFRDQLDILKFLLQEPLNKFFNLNDPDGSGNFPLHSAYRNDSQRMIEYLLNNRASLTQKNKYGQTILHLPTKDTNLDLVRYLVQEKKIPVNIRDDNGNTPLHIAAAYGNAAMVKCLLDLEADIKTCGKEQQTPLHAAIFTSVIYNHSNAITTITNLINAGADIHCVNSNFSSSKPSTPIDYSVSQISKRLHGYTDILKLLLEADDEETRDFHEKKLMHTFFFCLNYYHSQAALEKYNKSLVDAALGFLMGKDLNTLATPEINEKYAAHIRRLEGKAKGVNLSSETNLEGFWQEDYLALRIRFLFDLMIKVALNDVHVDHIGTQKQFASGFEKQNYVINHIKSELLDELEMWHTRKLISSRPKHGLKSIIECIPENERNSIYNIIAENIFKKINNLSSGKEYSIASGWAECKWHNLYLKYSLPTSLDEYSESYILVNDKLYYIKLTESKLIAIKVEIINFAEFSTKLKEINKDNSKKVALSSSQVNQLITVNSKENHKPDLGIGHAVYINFMHIENYLVIRIDNFGQGCYRKIQKGYQQIDLHKKFDNLLQHRQYKIYPCLLGCISWSDLSKNKSNLVNYITKILQADIEPYTDGFLKIYNLIENGTNWINNNEVIMFNPVPNNITATFDPLLAQTVGNCVIENCKYGQKIRLRDDKEFCDWIDEEEAKHLQTPIWWKITKDEDRADKKPYWWDQYQSVSPFVIQNRELSDKLKAELETFRMTRREHNSLLSQSRTLQNIYQNNPRIALHGAIDYVLSDCGKILKPKLALKIQADWIESLNLKWIFYIDLANLTNENYPMRRDFSPYSLSDILSKETSFDEIFSEKNSWLTWHAWHKNEILLLLDNYEVGINKIENLRHDIKTIFNTIINYPNCIFFTANNVLANSCMPVSLKEINLPTPCYGLDQLSLKDAHKSMMFYSQKMENVSNEPKSVLCRRLV